MHTSLMSRHVRQLSIAIVIAGLSLTSPSISAEITSPYGKAEEDLHGYSIINTVFDVYCQKPAQLADIFDDLEAISITLKGRIVVIIRGAEIAVFARQNYEQYRAMVDQLAQLSRQGVQFRLDKTSVHAAGFEAEDMHGFSTVVPSGLAEIAAMQDEGSRYLQFTPRRSGVSTKPEPEGTPGDEQNNKDSRFQFSM